MMPIVVRMEIFRKIPSRSRMTPRMIIAAAPVREMGSPGVALFRGYPSAGDVNHGRFSRDAGNWGITDGARTCACGRQQRRDRARLHPAPVGGRLVGDRPVAQPEPDR